MKIGYIRVSTREQNNDLQIVALKTIGCELFFKDTATRTNAKRSQLQKCFRSLNKGDTLAVYKLDRLGRSLGDIISLLDDLKARGIAFQSVTEAIDTTTPTGRAMWQMLGIMAELERSLIVERTKAGREAAKIRGVVMGRKPKLSNQQIEHARKLLAGQEHISIVAKSLNVSVRTLYRAIEKAPVISN